MSNLPPKDESGQNCVQISCLQVAEDAESSWQGAQMFKLHFQPDIIYASSRCDPELLDQLKEAYEDMAMEHTDEAEQHGKTKSCPIRLEKASSFTTDQVRFPNLFPLLRPQVNDVLHFAHLDCA